MSAAPITKPNFGSVDRPKDPAQQTLPASVWKEGKGYCATPPVPLSYSVELEATGSLPSKKNKRTLATDTEQDITLDVVAYWKHFVYPKVEWARPGEQLLRLSEQYRRSRQLRVDSEFH
jgi:hypothetical protein